MAVRCGATWAHTPHSANPPLSRWGGGGAQLRANSAQGELCGVASLRKVNLRARASRHAARVHPCESRRRYPFALKGCLRGMEHRAARSLLDVGCSAAAAGASVMPWAPGIRSDRCGTHQPRPADGRACPAAWSKKGRACLLSGLLGSPSAICAAGDRVPAERQPRTDPCNGQPLSRVHRGRWSPQNIRRNWPRASRHGRARRRPVSGHTPETPRSFWCTHAATALARASSCDTRPAGRPRP